MIKQRIEELTPDPAYLDREGWRHVELRWAVSRAATRSELGSVALVDVAPGGGYPVERLPDCERIVYVVRGGGLHHGDGDSVRLREGDGVLVPEGAWHGFENDGGDPVRLVALFAPFADVAQAAAERLHAADRGAGPAVIRVSASEVDYDPDLRDDMGFVGLDVKWLVNADTAGARHMLFGLSRFAPGGSHVLHRHPLVEEVIYVVSGAGQQLRDGDPVPVTAGDLTFASKGEWHGHVAGSEEMRFLFLYLGRSSLEQAGYELHDDTVAADV